MIQDAKLRRAEQRDVQILAFEKSVEALFSDNLRDVLELRCQWDDKGDTPIAVFRAGSSDWPIWRDNEDQTWKVRVLHVRTGPRDVAFTDEDSFLLAIDEYLK